ncbi:hypothetical protein BDV25DRAFT_159213 [Aspergillus avenaceus]|uniref:Uncharacterized protein n=1 Tax=Aspergillus avenaceus TaxID=36643 RepID=A0A5N6TNP9_ASPAV|nr:hypothetical protein BDV25DRAFT_159213 [Aspergillus avenaceus]
MSPRDLDNPRLWTTRMRGNGRRLNFRLQNGLGLVNVWGLASGVAAALILIPPAEGCLSRP